MTAYDLLEKEASKCRDKTLSFHKNHIWKMMQSRTKKALLSFNQNFLKNSPVAY